MNNLRIGIIGSGPSGLYALESILKAEPNATIDVFDRLPTPYGLLRGGVAPDHQKMKALEPYYERILANPNVAFWGNVSIGKDIGVNFLKQHYHALIFAVGAQTDRKLGIPGEELKGSHTATEFVGWYNGQPDFQHLHFNLNTKTVAIIGQGNVAIDVARILAKTPEELAHSDITSHALKALSQSHIEEIHLIGRRGPVQAAFTELEIKELGELSDCDVELNHDLLTLNPESHAELEESHKARKNYAILEELSRKGLSGKKKKIVIRFLESPIEIQGKDHVEKLILEKNTLSGESGNQKAVPTGQIETLECGLVFRSVGYRGVPIEGLPFDEKKGILPNENGRIANGLYCVGWIKRGPSGVLGSNKPDSKATIDTLLEDRLKLTCAIPDSTPVLQHLKENHVQVVSFQDWKRLDKIEKENGLHLGKPREKFTSVSDMLARLR